MCCCSQKVLALEIMVCFYAFQQIVVMDYHKMALAYMAFCQHNRHGPTAFLMIQNMTLEKV